MPLCSRMLSLSQYISLPLNLPPLFPISQCASLRTYAQGECCYKPWHSNPKWLMNFNMWQARWGAVFSLPPTCSQQTMKTGRRCTGQGCSLHTPTVPGEWEFYCLSLGLSQDQGSGPRLISWLGKGWLRWG